MNGRQLPDRFDLLDHQVVHHDIRPRTFFKNCVFVAQGQWALGDRLESCPTNLVRKECFVNGFPQPRAKFCMDCERGIRHRARNSIFLYFIQPWRTFASFA